MPRERRNGPAPERPGPAEPSSELGSPAVDAAIDAATTVDARTGVDAATPVDRPVSLAELPPDTEALARAAFGDGLAHAEAEDGEARDLDVPEPAAPEPAAAPRIAVARPPAHPAPPALSSPAGIPPTGGEAFDHTATAPQLRRFIKSRAYVPMHELRRRFGINGNDDEVTPVDLQAERVFVGLPIREGELLAELLRGGDIGYELSMDPIAPIVVGVYPMRPIPRS